MEAHKIEVDIKAAFRVSKRFAKRDMKAIRTVCDELTQFAGDMTPVDTTHLRDFTRHLEGIVSVLRRARACRRKS